MDNHRQSSYSPDSITVLDLFGKLTLGWNEKKLRSEINRLLDQGARSIVLNLRHLHFIDAAGLGQLAACAKLARSYGGTIRLLNPGRPTERLLELSKLTSVFEIHHDEQEAIRSIAESLGGDPCAAA